MIDYHYRLSKYGQYKADIFEKLDFEFIRGKKILDVGCGDGSDAEIFINEMGLETVGIDVYENENIHSVGGMKFEKASILDIPFAEASFDYVFLHDVIHHVDEKQQKRENHIAALKELKRVCKKGGQIIIVEGNRYNPIFYPRLVKISGHNHFRQNYFVGIVREVFDDVVFKHFEAHLYPKSLLPIFKVYEKLMEMFSPKEFLAYNVAIIKK